MMQRVRVVLLLALIASPLRGQAVARDSRPPTRLGIIGMGGDLPAMAFTAASMIDSSLRAAKVDGLALMPAGEIERFVRDIHYSHWSDDLGKGDLLALCRLLRLDGLLVLRIEPRDDSTVVHLRLLDAKLGEWISTSRSRQNRDFRESARALRPVADSLAQGFAHVR